MKRLAALAAAAVLGTGCIGTETCPTRDVTVSWTYGFFGPGTGQNNLSCGGDPAAHPSTDSGVSYVDVFVNGQQVMGPVPGGHFYCSDGGVTVTGVGRGSQLLTVEGLAADYHTILYRDEASLTPSGCDNYLWDSTPGQGTARLDYAFQAGPTCAAANSYMWFSIYDTIAGQYDPESVGSTSANPAEWACSSTIQVNLPAGNYRLTDITEQAYASGTYSEAAYGCKLPVTFDVATQALTPVPVSLADFGTACAP